MKTSACYLWHFSPDSIWGCYLKEPFISKMLLSGLLICLLTMWTEQKIRSWCTFKIWSQKPAGVSIRHLFALDKQHYVLTVLILITNSVDDLCLCYRSSTAVLWVKPVIYCWQLCALREIITGQTGSPAPNTPSASRHPSSSLQVREEPSYRETKDASYEFERGVWQKDDRRTETCDFTVIFQLSSRPEWAQKDLGYFDRDLDF